MGYSSAGIVNDGTYNILGGATEAGILTATGRIAAQIQSATGIEANLAGESFVYTDSEIKPALKAAKNCTTVESYIKFALRELARRA